MMRRCYDPEHTMYKYYGGMGIEVTKKWHTFENFKKDMGEPKPSQTLERLNPNIDYSKNNCKWEYWFYQRRSRTDNTYLEYEGYKYIETDWCYALGFKKGGSVSRRLNRGWDLERAVTTDNKGVRLTIAEIVNIIEYNINNKIYFCKKTKKFKKET